MNEENRLLDVISQQSQQIDLLETKVTKRNHIIMGLIGVVVSLIFLIIVT